MRLRVTVGLLLTVLAVISTGLALHLSMNKVTVVLSHFTISYRHM